MSIATITPSELNAKRQAGESPKVIDVRTPAEHRALHAEGVTLVPLDKMNAGSIVEEAGNTSLYIICKSGSRSREAAKKLEAAGGNITVVEGGTDAWAAAGLPVVRGKNVMSLERQVRIAAGSLVLVGVLLGYVLHPVLFGLSGFVGAGLVFAGVTDTCGMAMLLAKLPWNQVRETPPAARPATA